jgi:hypothetical protein
MIRYYVEAKVYIYRDVHALQKHADGNTLPDSCSPSDKPPQPAKISRVARQFSGITVSFPEPACLSSQICFPLFFFKAEAFLVRVMSLTFIGSWLRDKTSLVSLSEEVSQQKKQK